MATAVVGAVDALVSWNMKHIVHPQKIPQFTEVSQQLGYAPLRIVTPKEVVSYG